MKKQVFVLFVMFAFFLPPVVWAGEAFKTVYGTVETSGGGTPADEELFFTSYIVGREGDTQNQDSPGCWYSNGDWLVTVNNFDGTWSVGEVFRIDFTDAGSGELFSTAVMLDASISQSADDVSVPVDLPSFTAIAGDKQVCLHWVTKSEIDNLGFHVYRALAEEGGYERLTAERIKGAGSTPIGQTYSFADIRLTNGVTYWYKLEDIAFDGTRTVHGPVSAKPKPVLPVRPDTEESAPPIIATTWGEIKQSLWRR